MKRWLFRLSLALVALLGLAVLAGWLWLRASLPQLDGRQALAGLQSDVGVLRDDRGVVTVTAHDDIDLARAVGFVHAQERFFQMDLLRRSAAGEISALVGAAALDYDRARRRHGMREVAADVLASMGDAERTVLRAYAEGVNDGLDALGARPFEYGVLRMQPKPWKPEDSVLVIFAMYFDLQDEDARRERALADLRAVFPEAFVNFLVPAGTRWDAPIEGDALEAPPLPGTDVVDLRDYEADERVGAIDLPAAMPGSNNWAVTGALTRSGVPVVANDMHLGLGLPNIWFRMRLQLQGEHGYDVTGVSLPGLPAIIAGSNGHIAWGFTNSYGDWIDLVRLETEGCEDGYRTPRGCRNFDVREESIEVAHAAPVPFTFLRTEWGPVIEEKTAGSQLRYALHWTAHEPAATNLRLRDFARVANADEAVSLAHEAGMPAQNLVVADKSNIAWTIIGRIPVRDGRDGSRPLLSSQTDAVWNGWLESSRYPLIRNPAGGRLWTANARVTQGEALSLVGDGGYALGARAAQIRDRLFEGEAFSANDMLAIQLDDDARFLARWREVLLRVLDDNALAASPERRRMRELLADWSGRASVDSVAYRLVHEFRAAVYSEVFADLTAPVTAAFPDFAFNVFSQSEGPLWRLLEKRPANLLPPDHASWDALLLDAADRVREELSSTGDLADRTWGERNRVAVEHPLGQLPVLGALLNAEPRALPGDSHMPRVQSAGFGASERFAVSPGDEENGYFHMPGGQSGHPLSPFYLTGHDDWEQGIPEPFLPGPVAHELTLESGE